MRPPLPCYSSLAARVSAATPAAAKRRRPAAATSCAGPRSTQRAVLLSRAYATQHQRTAKPSFSSSSSSSSSSAARRRAVTPFNDDGGVPWTELSAGEKTARAAQQTFNFGLVAAGVVLTGGVVYFLYTEVFAPGSKVVQFNHAVDRIKADPQCTDVLGGRSTIAAFGEPTWNKWRRARPIASTTRTDAQGEHLLLTFYVRGERAQGTAQVHLVRQPGGGGGFVYRTFYVDVPGYERIYLENAPGSGGGDQAGGGKKTTLFGIKWS
ncbi:import inner membrane translocase subunit tim-mitochondrial [Niveomyces insectorum RCEF 264]|uniref:Mitochondrial import inner membrane translocase subunit Tim21 n=1 Tax=Niveomyces insectorum RCEF 264 TaxID=1081102 RepID=A0A167MWC3_9HYPO|nr:import inner membrane translocase subunit tim-mitochondrial [Niveomyces insectorum RCEF 264]